jgi:hypothetical protein
MNDNVPLLRRSSAERDPLTGRRFCKAVAYRTKKHEPDVDAGAKR